MSCACGCGCLSSPICRLFIAWKHLLMFGCRALRSLKVEAGQGRAGQGRVWYGRRGEIAKGIVRREVKALMSIIGRRCGMSDEDGSGVYCDEHALGLGLQCIGEQLSVVDN